MSSLMYSTLYILVCKINTLCGGCRHANATSETLVCSTEKNVITGINILCQNSSIFCHKQHNFEFRVIRVPVEEIFILVFDIKEYSSAYLRICKDDF